jgi:PKHD-type hydroxylase
MSVLLTNPDEYEGGDLELWPGGEIKRVERKQYTMTIFPSCIMHRVTPVTKGVRKSLVFWVGGTPYR